MGRQPQITDEELIAAFRPYVNENGIAHVRVSEIAAKLNFSYCAIDGRILQCPRIVRVAYNTFRVYDDGCERCGSPRGNTNVVRFGSETHSELCWPCIKQILSWVRAGVRK